MQCLWARGDKEGPLFSNDDGKPMSIGEPDVYFHALLKKNQHHYPKVIGENIDMGREYSTYRLSCRGYTSEAQNAGITINVIELHNCWRKRFRSSGIKPNTPMMENYTDEKFSAPLLIKVSKLLPS